MHIHCHHLHTHNTITVVADISSSSHTQHYNSGSTATDSICCGLSPSRAHDAPTWCATDRSLLLQCHLLLCHSYCKLLPPPRPTTTITKVLQTPTQIFQFSWCVCVHCSLIPPSHFLRPRKKSRPSKQYTHTHTYPCS